MPLLHPFGPAAFRFSLPAPWPEDLGGRAALARALLAIDGVLDASVTESAGLVVCARAPESTERDVLEAAVAEALRLCAGAPAGPRREHVVDVVYDGADLEDLARWLGLDASEIVARHTASPLHVSFLGFVPGFAYLRGLEPALASVPRRADPRRAVPAFSVAIAAGMSAIYPATSPGGWNLLGRAIGFDPFATPLEPGDAVRFRAVDAACAVRHTAPAEGGSLDAPRDCIEITSIAGPTLVVDAAPHPRLHLGAPAGGPLAPGLARHALRAVDACRDDALFERYGAITLVLRATTPRRLADERGEVITLRPGEALTLPAPRNARVGYVALEGGLDVPRVLGGRGTLLSVRRGGHEGRVLRRGDHVSLGERIPPRESRWPLPISDHARVLTLSAGPDLLSARDWPLRVRIAHASDRTGTRLVPLAPHGLVAREGRSAPTLQGAVQAPPSGELIVLGPDHPVTGGYPVIGVLDAAACDDLFSRTLGSEVALCLGP